MVASVGAAVETGVDPGSPSGAAAGVPLQLRLLGPLEIRCNGVPLPLPASRKVRGLLAYLALAPREVTRSQLCELLWDVPNDPRGELRWCLSKIRRLLDEAGRQRVVTLDGAVRLDLSGCFVDAVEVQRGMKAGGATLATAEAEALSALMAGDLLEGLELDHSPAFAGWLAAQRRQFRGAQLALLERLAGQAHSEASLGHLERWLELAPLDRRVHELYLGALARCGRIRDGEEHVRAATRRFEDEGLDVEPLRRAWQLARRQEAAPAPSAALEAPVTAPRQVPEAPGFPASHRASVAVLPFRDQTGAPARGGVGDALAHDVITRLAKLRCLFVIAEGTVFALEDRLPQVAAGRLLDVDYLVAGAVRADGDRLSVEVQIDEVRTARVVWSSRLEERRDGTFDVLEEIGNRIVASIASEIEANERNRAILKQPSSLDAWEAHHRGLWHMYRFTREDNEAARGFFERAVALDPTFSRAQAGLSFTHWQNAFQGWAERQAEMARALEAARRGMLADDRDPAVHWAQGRALWLQGLHDQSVLELLQAVDLSPNFAQGHYTLAFVQAQDGDPLAAIAAVERARALSPFDPLLFGMLGARAIALLRLGRLQEAAEAARMAAARPNAHAHIQAIAAFSLALAGELDEARLHAEAAHRLVPGYSLAHFRKAFRLDEDGAARFAEGARQVGMG